MKTLKIFRGYLMAMKEELERRALETDDMILKQMYNNALEHVELALKEIEEIIRFTSK